MLNFNTLTQQLNIFVYICVGGWGLTLNDSSLSKRKERKANHLNKRVQASPSGTFSYLIKSLLIIPLLLFSYPLLWVSGSGPQIVPSGKHSLQFVFKTTKTYFIAVMINDKISVNTSPPFVELQEQHASSYINLKKS